MALILGKKETRTITVKAVEPGDNLKTTEHKFDVEFKLLTQHEREAIESASSNGDERGAQELIIESIVSIKNLDLENEKGEKLQYSHEIGLSMLDLGWLRRALFSAFHAVQGGLSQAEYYAALRKN